MIHTYGLMLVLIEADSARTVNEWFPGGERTDDRQPMNSVFRPLQTPPLLTFHPDHTTCEVGRSGLRSLKLRPSYIGVPPQTTKNQASERDDERNLPPRHLDLVSHVFIMMPHASYCCA